MVYSVYEHGMAVDDVERKRQRRKRPGKADGERLIFTLYCKRTYLADLKL